MNNELTYDYVGIIKFGLNRPPFTLNVFITNFTDNKCLQLSYITEKYSNLPRNISEFLNNKHSFTLFSEFINYFDLYSDLHFEINLHNQFEHIHNQYLTKKIFELNLNNYQKKVFNK